MRPVGLEPLGQKLFVAHRHISPGSFVTSIRRPIPTRCDRRKTMEARLKNPAALVPGAMQAIQGLIGAVHKAGTPDKVLQLAHLRASQINGCAACIDGGVKHAKQAGETDDRLFTVSAWREAPYFSDAERAALALAEAMTRLDDRADPVPDEIWNEARKHFDERSLSGLVLWIATTNFFNRLNVTTRQPAGVTW
jgi:AhpD family alkylhydroperoxidase